MHVVAVRRVGQDRPGAADQARHPGIAARARPVGLVADALRALGADVQLVRVRTLGDVSDAPLSSMGGVGVFVTAVREAVLSGDV